MRIESLVPDLLALKVEAKHSQVAEPAINVLAVRYRGFRGETVLKVDRTAWLSFVNLPFRPGKSVFQAMFSSGDQRSGSLSPAATPGASGASKLSPMLVRNHRNGEDDGEKK